MAASVRSFLDSVTTVNTHPPTRSEEAGSASGAKRKVHVETQNDRSSPLVEEAQGEKGR
jgi:hypothetical protein